MTSRSGGGERGRCCTYGFEDGEWGNETKECREGQETKTKTKKKQKKTDYFLDLWQWDMSMN